MSTERKQALFDAVFGDGSDSSELHIEELDDAKNRDANGQVKSTFHPGEPFYFRIHHGPRLVLSRIRVSSGIAHPLGLSTHDHHQDADPADSSSTVELPHIPITNPVSTWWGNVPQISRAGRVLSFGEPLPAIGIVRYAARWLVYKYIPPPMHLATEEDEYRVKIVAHYEAAP